MKTNCLFSLFPLAAVFWLMLIWPALAANPEEPRLSPAQVSVIAKQIARLKYPQERALAAGWTGLPLVATPRIKLESGRYRPAFGLTGAQRRTGQTLAARSFRAQADDSRAKNAV